MKTCPHKLRQALLINERTVEVKNTNDKQRTWDRHTHSRCKSGRQRMTTHTTWSGSRTTKQQHQPDAMADDNVSKQTWKDAKRSASRCRNCASESGKTGKFDKCLGDKKEKRLQGKGNGNITHLTCSKVTHIPHLWSSKATVHTASWLLLGAAAPSNPLLGAAASSTTSPPLGAEPLVVLSTSSPMMGAVWL